MDLKAELDTSIHLNLWLFLALSGKLMCRTMIRRSTRDHDLSAKHI